MLSIAGAVARLFAVDHVARLPGRLGGPKYWRYVRRTFSGRTRNPLQLCLLATALCSMAHGALPLFLFLLPRPLASVLSRLLLPGILGPASWLRRIAAGAFLVVGGLRIGIKNAERVQNADERESTA